MDLKEEVPSTPLVVCLFLVGGMSVCTGVTLNDVLVKE